MSNQAYSKTAARTFARDVLRASDAHITGDGFEFLFQKIDYGLMVAEREGSSEFFNAAFERFMNQLLEATNHMTSSFNGKDGQGRWRVGSVDIQLMMTGRGGICPLWPFC